VPRRERRVVAVDAAAARAAPDADIFATGGARSYATHAHVRAEPAAAVFGGGRAGGGDAELEKAYGKASR
jgi:hypothetical protein